MQPFLNFNNDQNTVILILSALYSLLNSHLVIHYYQLSSFQLNVHTFKFTNLDSIILTNEYTSLTHIPSRYKIFLSLQKVLLCLFQSVFPLQPPEKTMLVFLKYSQTCLFQNINQIIWYMIFYMQFFILSIQFVIFHL